MKSIHGTTLTVDDKSILDALDPDRQTVLNLILAHLTLTQNENLISVVQKTDQKLKALKNTMLFWLIVWDVGLCILFVLLNNTHFTGIEFGIEPLVVTRWWIYTPFTLTILLFVRFMAVRIIRNSWKEKSNKLMQNSNLYLFSYVVYLWDEICKLTTPSSRKDLLMKGVSKGIAIWTSRITERINELRDIPCDAEPQAADIDELTRCQSLLKCITRLGILLHIKEWNIPKIVFTHDALGNVVCIEINGSKHPDNNTEQLLKKHADKVYAEIHFPPKK